MDNKGQVTSARARGYANLRPVKKGEKGRNPKGRPPGKSLKQLLREINEADWLAIITDAVSKAKAGDSRAREWLAKHSLESALIEVTTKKFTIELDRPSDDEEGDVDAD